VNRGCREG